MGLFGKIVATAVNVATLPVAVAKDVVTLGNAHNAGHHRLPAPKPVEPEPKEGDKCEWCGEVDAAHPVMEGVNGHVLRECLTFEPAQVESRDGLLPPLTGISGDLKVSTVLHCLTQRERQLLASLQREKDLKGLLTEILGHLMIIADTHYEEDLCVQIKAAVGEGRKV